MKKLPSEENSWVCFPKEGICFQYAIFFRCLKEPTDFANFFSMDKLREPPSPKVSDNFSTILYNIINSFPVICEKSQGNNQWVCCKGPILCYFC